MDLRADNRRRTLIKRADFPQLKYLGDIIPEELPQDGRTALPVLQTLDFVRQGRNVILYGNPGTGKTHIATALGIEACRQGMTVMFSSVPRLITQIREARQERSLRALENRFTTYDLVICDEFGYVSCDKEAGELLFNHLSLRAGKKSIIISSIWIFNLSGRLRHRSGFENGIDSFVVIGMNQAVNEVMVATCDCSYPYATQSGLGHFGHKGTTTFANYAGGSCFVFLFETGKRLLTIFDGEQSCKDNIEACLILNKYFIFYL